MSAHCGGGFRLPIPDLSFLGLLVKRKPRKATQNTKNVEHIQILEGSTRKPRHASVFSMHSDTQAVPAFHCI